MFNIGIREMLEAGTHFGHQTHRWNPKMKKYIFIAKNGMHIIDLQKTVNYFKIAGSFLFNVVLNGGKILFVGTKNQAKDIIKKGALESDQFYVNNRWLGGTLTNFKTIKQSIHSLRKIEIMSTDGTFNKLPKKEVIYLTRKLVKLKKNLNGIKNMTKVPKAIFIIDTKKEHIAIIEAKKLGIPIIATVDTNCNPDDIDYIIPANDDSIKSIKLFVNRISNICVEATKSREESLLLKKK